MPLICRKFHFEKNAKLFFFCGDLTLMKCWLICTAPIETNIETELWNVFKRNDTDSLRNHVDLKSVTHSGAKLPGSEVKKSKHGESRTAFSG